MSQAFQFCKFQTNGPVNGVKSLPLMIIKCGESDYFIGSDLTRIQARLVLESDLKHIGPDLLSCSIKRNRVRVDIRVRLKNIELDYPETGKHPLK